MTLDTAVKSMEIDDIVAKIENDIYHIDHTQLESEDIIDVMQLVYELADIAKGTKVKEHRCYD